MNILGFSDEPDFVNPEGTKWWLDKSTTAWARKEDVHGTKLDFIVYLVEKTDGYIVRLMLDNDGNLIAEEQNLEQLAVKIDMLKAAKRMVE